MNVYKFNVNGEIEYVCASTTIEAIHVLLKTHDMLFEDLDHTDDIKEIPKGEWDKYTIFDDESIMDLDGNYAPLMTFGEYMAEAKTPELFCSTANM